MCKHHCTMPHHTYTHARSLTLTHTNTQAHTNVRDTAWQELEGDARTNFPKQVVLLSNRRPFCHLLANISSYTGFLHRRLALSGLWFLCRRFHLFRCLCPHLCLSDAPLCLCMCLCTCRCPVCHMQPCIHACTCMQQTNMQHVHKQHTCMDANIHVQHTHVHAYMHMYMRAVTHKNTQSHS